MKSVPESGGYVKAIKKGVTYIDENVKDEDINSATSSCTNSKWNLSNSGDLEFSLYAKSNTGYTFKGWTTDKNASSGNMGETNHKYRYTISYTSQSTSSPGVSFNYYAIFSPNTYTVTYDANGGTIEGNTTENVSETYDATYTLPAPDSRAGYLFDGWYTDANAGTKVTDATIVQITSAQTLYAHWKPIFNFSVSVGKNEGATNLVSASVGDAQIIGTHGQASAETTATFTATADAGAGYQFDGWYPDEAYDIETRISTANPYQPTLVNSTPGATTSLTLYARFSSELSPTFTPNFTPEQIAALQVGDMIENAFSLNNTVNPTWRQLAQTINPINDGSGVIEYDSENNRIIARNAGTASYRFEQAATGLISAGNSDTWHFSVSKRTPSLTWFGGTIYINRTYPEFFDLDGDLLLATSSSSDETVATIEGTILRTFDKTTATTIRVSTTENYMWLPLSEQSKTFSPSIPQNHVEFTINSEAKMNTFRKSNTGKLSWTSNRVLLGSANVGSGATNWDDRYYDVEFSGIPDKLSFSYERSTSISTGCDWFVQESADGSNWTNTVWSKRADDGSENDLQLAPSTRFLRFCYSGNYGGYFGNIHVTELQYFRATPSHLDFGSNHRYTEPAAQVITLEHCNAGNTTTVSAPSQYVVSLDGIHYASSQAIVGTGADEMGSICIYVKYLTDEVGTHNGNVTITNNLRATINIPITGTTTADVDTYYMTGDNSWDELGSWHLNNPTGAAPINLPTLHNPVVLQAKATVPNGCEAQTQQLTLDGGIVLVMPDGGLTVGDGGITDAAGEAITDASFIVLQAGGHGDAYEGQTGYLRIDPSATVARPYATVELYSKSFYGTHARWQYIGSPIVGASATDYFYGSFLYGWDETNTSSVWKTTGAYHIMQPFAGYATTTKKAEYTNGHIIRYAGELNQITHHTCDVTCTAGQNDEDKGWNLIANSWTAPIDMTRFEASDFPAGAECTFYIYNTGSMLEARYGYDFESDGQPSRYEDETLIGTGSEAGQYVAISPLSAGYLASATQKVIPAMQGFFYVTNQNGTLHLDYDRLVWGGTQSNRPIRAPQRQGEGQRSEVESQRSEVESQKSEVESQKSEVESQKSEVESQKSEVESQRSEVESQKSEVESQRAEVERQKSEVERQRAEEGQLSEKEQELTSRVYLHLMAANDSTADHLYLLEKEGWTAGYDNGYDARKVLQPGLTSIYTTEAEGKMAVSASDKIDGTYIGIQTGADSLYVLRFAYLIGDTMQIRDMATDSVFTITADRSYVFSATPNSRFDQRFRIEQSSYSENTGHPGIATGQQDLPSSEQLWLIGNTINASGTGLFSLYDAVGRLISTQQIAGTKSIDLSHLPQGIYVARLGNQSVKVVVRCKV